MNLNEQEKADKLAVKIIRGLSLYSDDELQTYDNNKAYIEHRLRLEMDAHESRTTSVKKRAPRRSWLKRTFLKEK